LLCYFSQVSDCDRPNNKLSWYNNIQAPSIRLISTATEIKTTPHSQQPLNNTRIYRTTPLLNTAVVLPERAFDFAALTISEGIEATTKQIVAQRLISATKARLLLCESFCAKPPGWKSSVMTDENFP
jgi:hypothetical protein